MRSIEIRHGLYSPSQLIVFDGAPVLSKIIWADNPEMQNGTNIPG